MSALGKIRFVLFCLVFISLLSSLSNAQEKLIGLHVVFDLDGTLIQNADEIPQDERATVIEYQGQSYRLNKYALESIALLAEQGYNISIFSGGNRERNLYVVKNIQELLLQKFAMTWSPYKLLNYDELTPVWGKPITLPTRERFKKDLQKIAFPMDVVMIDDIKNYAMPGQERSFLIIPGTIRNNLEQAKLLVMTEVLLEAKELLKSSNRIQFLQAVQGLAKGTMPDQNYDDEVYRDFILKAQQRLSVSEFYSPQKNSSIKNSVLLCEKIFL